MRRIIYYEKGVIIEEHEPRLSRDILLNQQKPIEKIDPKRLAKHIALKKKQYEK